MIEGHDFEFVFIAVEKTPPYGINTFVISGRGIRVAEEKISRVMGDFSDCFQKNSWPCYKQYLHKPDVPGWVKFD